MHRDAWLDFMRVMSNLLFRERVLLTGSDGEATPQKKAAGRTGGSTGGPTLSFLSPPEHYIVPDPKTYSIVVFRITPARIRQEGIALDAERNESGWKDQMA